MSNLNKTAAGDRLRGDDVSRVVFADLPARYDRLAYLLSFGQDRRWRRAVVTGSPRPGRSECSTSPPGRPASPWR